jgi:uroporphyrinogen decarboxylase
VTSKERLMLALNREKPDRLPVSVHQWQKYHLDVTMNGMDDLAANKAVGFDAQIQYFESMAQFWLENADFTKLNSREWRDEAVVIDHDPDHRVVHHTIGTPEGPLTYKTEGDRKTTWITEYLLKRDEDIELLRKYMPVPRLDLDLVSVRYDEVGDAGILRGFVWGDQAGCWQHAACLIDINALLMAAIDKPDWVHALLRILLDKKMRFIESMKGAKFDLIETGGGSASSTLISPKMHAEFCLPYDRVMHDALHGLGFKVVYHTCGGTFGIEEHIIANGTDASETLAPVSIGGNQEPWEFKRKIGRRLALIGGLDQHSVLTTGTPEDIRRAVRKLFETVGAGGGYVCSASDHFFETPVGNLAAFAASARDCVYSPG